MYPTDNFTGPMLTDLYQLTMAYAYWKNGKQDDPAVFDLFFRKNPFGGEFTVFAGLEESLKLLSEFRFTDEDILFLKEGVTVSRDKLEHVFQENLENGSIRETPSGYERFIFNARSEQQWEPVCEPREGRTILPVMGHCEEDFFKWLKDVNCSEIKIRSFREGSVVFPRIPLLRVEGPLAVAQLLETPLLVMTNYPSLVATKAARLRLAAGPDKTLMEFGLRRAQGPDGGISGSRYACVGGFDSTSNVLAGKLFSLKVSGTHAHSFVSSFTSLKELKSDHILSAAGEKVHFTDLVLKYRRELDFETANEGELAAFIAYAMAFPANFLALVDTYDTLKSGTPNFLCVALALKELGYRPVGIRLDSGDLAYFSKMIRHMFQSVENKYENGFSNLSIVASNDIDEDTIYSLNQQKHEIDIFGVGTRLVTCYDQPALGGVYKLVMINGQPRIKISQEVEKITIPGRKVPYRLIGDEGFPILDLMIEEGEQPPEAGGQILCRHPFNSAKRAYVIPHMVKPLHHLMWDGRITMPFPSIQEKRAYCMQQLSAFRKDHLRALNPTPYKVSVTDSLYNFIHKLWQEETPIPVIS